METTGHRRILTFMRRSSPLTSSQQRGIEEFSSRYLCTRANAPLTSESLFGNSQPLTVEIGFGMGHSLIEMAENEPGRNFLGLEVHHPGIAQICFEAGMRHLSNLHVIEDDALEVLEHCVPDGCIDSLQLYFPDPWQKKKHHKRRLVNEKNVALIWRKLCPGGRFHMATDWQPYAEWMLEVMEAAPGYRNLAGNGQYAPRPERRPLTKFEKRGINEGHGVWDLLYEKIDAPTTQEMTNGG